MLEERGTIELISICAACYGIGRSGWCAGGLNATFGQGSELSLTRVRSDLPRFNSDPVIVRMRGYSRQDMSLTRSSRVWSLV
jgi:hypothetical protein